MEIVYGIFMSAFKIFGIGLMCRTKNYPDEMVSRL